jgi:hypothetical protein
VSTHLIAFLRARLAEDETSAHNAMTIPRWRRFLLMLRRTARRWKP